MKKKHIIRLLILFMLFLCSCTGNNYSDGLADLTEKAAADIVLEKIGDNNGTRIVEVEGSKTLDDTDYYLVHAYSLGPVLTDENGNEFQQTYTFNWFYVNKRTGEIYIEKINRQSSSLVLYEEQ